MNDKIFGEMAEQMRPSEELQRKLAERLEAAEPANAAEDAPMTPPADEPRRTRHATVLPIRARWLAVAAAAVLATALVVSTTVTQRPAVESEPAAGPAPTPTPAASASPAGAPASAYADLYRQVAQLREKMVVVGPGDYVEYTGSEKVLPVPAGPVGAADTGGQAVPQPVAGQAATQTNVQVAGVDEADIVKTDGRRIYVATGSKIAIVDATGATTSQLATIDLAETLKTQLNWSTALGPVSELMLSGSTLIAMVVEYAPLTTDSGISPSSRWTAFNPSQWIAFGAVRTRAVAYDVSDPAHPRHLFTHTQSGGYLSSRLSDGVFYLLSDYELNQPGDIKAGDPKTFVPLVGGDEPEPVGPDRVHVLSGAGAPEYTVIAAISVADGDQLGAQAILGHTDTIYQSTENLYLVSYDWQNKVPAAQRKAAGVSGVNLYSATDLTRIQLDGGKLTLAAQTKIPGQVLNQFALDEYEGHLRIAVNVSGDRGGEAWANRAALYVLDQKLAIVGALPTLAKNEQVQAVRFDGPVGYVVTFEQVDPLFAINLSNPAKPKVSSALKIPGFSNYLHVWSDGQLLGLGVAGDNQGQTQGLKLSMFNVSDPFKVTEEKSRKVSYDYSEALDNHKAVLVDQARNLIGFSVVSWDSGVQNYLMFSYDGKKGFTARATLKAGTLAPTDSDIMPVRGLIIGDAIYLCSANGVQAYALDSYTQLARLSLPKA